MRVMTTRIAWAMVALSLLALPIDGQQRFTSRAEGVLVDVLVTDGTRRLRGLTADDFEVRDNGVVQRVTEMDVERIPLNVVCLFDSSSSVAGARQRELVAAGRAFVDQLRESDRVAFLAFATHVSLLVPLTPDHDRVRRALDNLRPVGLTSLRDAVFAGLTLRDADPARTLMLIFSDGDDTSSWLGNSAVIDAAKRTDVVAYAVRTPESMPIVLIPSRDPNAGVPQSRLPVITQSVSPSDQHARFLDTIAAETGGQVTRLKADKDLTAAFVSILGEFRDRYVLSYAPAGVATSGWHELTVRLKGKSGKVTARRGYFSESPH